MREKYESLSVAVLRDLAKSRGIAKVSTMKKAELIEAMVAEDEKAQPASEDAKNIDEKKKETTEEIRNKIIIKMAKKGVACNVHYKPLPMMTAYMNLGFDIKDYPNAYHQYQNQITLPLYSKLTKDDVDFIINCFKESLEEYGCC